MEIERDAFGRLTGCGGEEDTKVADGWLVDVAEEADTDDT